MRKLFKIFSIIVLLIGVMVYFYFIYPVWGYLFNAQLLGNPPLTPTWALECWLWEDDINTYSTKYSVI